MADFYKDIDFSLRTNTVTGDILSLDDIEAVKQSIVNLVLTAKGEKAFRTIVGTNVHKLLFSNMPSQPVLFRIQRQIEFVIKNFESRVTNVRVEIFTKPEQHLLVAKIYFRIIGSPEIIPIELPLITLR